MKLVDLQKQLDKVKYIDSENANCDTCGTYKFCIVCNKKNKYPCAAAYQNFMKKYENKEVM